MHLVVLHGYQGAYADPEQLALTDQLFDAALGELSVWPGDSLVCWLVISTWSHQNPFPVNRDFGWVLG